MWTSIITGDIINSRAAQNNQWLTALKAALNQYGTEPKSWEIYRGDSFQLEMQPEQALFGALYIKTCIRQFKGLDVRMAVGIGEKRHDAEKITEANGSAFQNSGACFENLKKSTLAVKSPWPEFDREVNGNIQLALLSINRWTTNISHLIKVCMENPYSTQKELSKILNKSQSTLSESLTRAGFEEIMQMEERYRKLINSQ